MKEVLKNPHRRRILELLASRKVLTPKEIADELHISVPTVYYHLELLGGYVQKTARGEFSATEKGLEVYRSDIMNASPGPYMMSMIYSSISWLVARPRWAVLLGLAALALELGVCRMMSFVPFLMGYRPVLDTSALPIYYAVSVIAVFLVLEAFSYAMSRRLGGEVQMLAGILISRLPLLLVFMLVFFGLDEVTISIAVTAVAQLLSIFVLSTFLSFSKGLRQEISIILGLGLLYLNLLAYSSFQI